MRARSRSVAFFSILLVGISATLLSALPTATYHPPSPCSLGYIEAGYPFPWYTRPIYTHGRTCCNPTVLCLLYPINSLNPWVRILYFLVDILFYGALVVAIITAYRSPIIISRRFRVSPRNPGEHHSKKIVLSSP